MNLFFFLFFLNLFKIFITRFFPLIGDEAYYWLWSKHLDFGYVDHPPAIAYVYYLLTTFFGNHDYVIRLGAIVLVLLISLVIYLTAKELYDEKSAITSVVIFNLLPLFFGGGIFLVPQTLLFLFWATSFYFVVKIVKTNREIYWYPLGLALGLGSQSDYIMPLFIVALTIFLFLNPEKRFWFSKKEPYIALLLSLTIFSPIILWNIFHHFPSVAYHHKRATAANLDNLISFFILQILLYTPPIFLSTLKRIYNFFQKNFTPDTIFSISVFLPFALISPWVMVGGHWPATAYLPSILSFSREKRRTLGISIFFALLVNFLVLSYYLFLYPTPQELKGKEYSLNYQLPKYIADSKANIVIANNLGLAGLVAFYGKTKVYMPPGRHAQYDLWGKPTLKEGDEILYFALDEPEIYEKLVPLFQQVKIDPQKRIFTKDADIPNKTIVYICQGFKGGTIP